MKKTTVIIIVILAAAATAAALKTYTSKTAGNLNNREAASDESQSAATAAAVEITNPASENCSQVGGNLVIQEREDGSQYGLCYFEDNKACEEWALFRGDCPIGGRKTTGLDTIDQKYCVWVGGETSAVPQSVCVFKDGSRCLTSDFYKSGCPV
jgi:putative hemolysin